MKAIKIIIITFLILTRAFYSGAVKTILSGHIKYGPKSTVTVQYYASPLDYIEQTHTNLESAIDQNGNFKVEMDIDKPVSINVMNGESWLFTNKFIGPGDSLSIEFDKDQLNVNGKGENGISGMFEFQYQFVNPRIAEMQGTLKTRTDIEFAKYWSDWVDSGLAFYNRYYKAHPASIAYIRAAEKAVKYEAAVNMVQFGWRGKNANDSIFSNPAYRRYLDRFAFNDTNALIVDHYIFMLQEIPKYFVEPMGFKKPIGAGYYEKVRLQDSVARVYFSGPVFDLALYTILYHEVQNVIRNKGNGIFDTTYAKTERLVHELGGGFNDKKYLSRIKEKLAATKEADRSANDFTATDLNGKEVKLSDFRGKVVYVDFWATNCAPCVAEIPYMKKLQEAYKGKDIVFLMVSFDKSKELLGKFIQQREFTGLHVMLPRGFASDAALKYHISGIPRYLIVDRKGNLVSGDAPRPSGHPQGVIDGVLARR